MRLGGLQPGYLPGLVLFDQAYRTDAYIIADEMQFTERDWRNRNRIKTLNSWCWLTVPVYKKGRFGQRINSVEIVNEFPWKKRHRDIIYQFYCNAPFFNDYFPFLEEVYRADWKYLNELDWELIKYFIEVLGIKTPTYLSSRLGLENKYLKYCNGNPDSTERIIFHCREMGANGMLVGVSAKNYIDETKFEEAGIELIYQDYRHPIYPQQHGDFIPYLSIVDLLMNVGPKSLEILAQGSAHQFP